MPNFRLDLCYDGSRYRGWQRLGDSEHTIQGKLEQVISRMVGRPTEVIGSGRTDGGVHAMGQVANFHAETALSAAEILAYLRRYLPEDIGVLAVTEVDPRFHSRYQAAEKTYRYRIWNADVPCVFERKYVWQVPEPLNLDAMAAGAALLLGTHDFLPFSSLKKSKKSTVRTLKQLEINRVGPELQITAVADGFLYHMVRILVGTLVDIGQGKLLPAEISAVFEAGVRADAGQTAPPKGLCLMEVKYP